MITASCLFCHKEFPLLNRRQQRHTCHRSNVDYNRRKSHEYYINARKNHWGTWACCVFCREEFKIERKDQRMHGCTLAKKDYKAVRDRGVTELRKGIRIMDNLHPCPKCKVVLTANRYMCSACWDMMGSNYDVDMSIVVEAGTARRITYGRGMI